MTSEGNHWNGGNVCFTFHDNKTFFIHMLSHICFATVKQGCTK